MLEEKTFPFIDNDFTLLTGYAFGSYHTAIYYFIEAAHENAQRHRPTLLTVWSG
jgi:hypothetical protein